MDWNDKAPAMRREAHYGDRVVRCYAERPANLNDMLENALRRNAEGEALVCNDRRLSWAEVGEYVARITTGLKRRGVKCGSRVALLLENSLEFPLTFFAIWRLGAIAVPLSHRSQEAELRYMLGQCGAIAIVHHAQLGAQLPAPEHVPQLKHRIAIGDFAGSESFESLANERGEVGIAPVAEEDAALILYTSGTTGHPKGAMITHLNLVHAAMTYEYCMRLTMRERTVVAVPMSHVTGIAATIVTPLRCASTLIIMSAFKASEYLKLAANEHMTHTVMVPAMYNLCLLGPDFDRYDLSSWRVGGYGGAPMAPATVAQLAERLPKLQLMNCYGATETVVPIAIMPPDETSAHLDRVGRVVPCAELIVVNDNGREVVPGEQGELWIRGPMVVRGYWNNAEATRDNFTGGFWHSGDIGSLDAEGRVGVHDRKKDMINRGGYKVFSIEVENVLMAHPGVVEAAVVAKPCPVLGERVHAFVTLKDKGVTADTLKSFCAQQLSDYKVPESYTLSTEPLPRNANGKLLKRELRDRLQADSPRL